MVVSSGFNTNAATAEEAAVINAAIEYYQYDEVGDYYTTYDLLSYEDQNNYTQDQWVAANTNLDRPRESSSSPTPTRTISVWAFRPTPLR